MARTIGGNPLRNAAIRQGNPLPRKISRPYTDEDRRRLLAPTTIRSFGGKSWGGAFPTSRDFSTGRKYTNDRYGYATDRYGHASDWTDLDRTT